MFFSHSVLRPFQDYFSSYDTGQSVVGAKMGEPQEKPPDTPASRSCHVSHVARTRTRHSGEMIERLRDSALIHSATGAAKKKKCLIRTKSQRIINYTTIAVLIRPSPKIKTYCTHIFVAFFSNTKFVAHYAYSPTIK